MTATSFVAMLGFAAGESVAADPGSVKARVQNGTLQITGTPGADKLALRLEPGNPTTLDLDVGDDGTVDFSFNRSTFMAINVQGGAGDDAIRIDESGGAFSDDPVTLGGGPGNDTLTGGSGADIIEGGSGHDTLVFDGSNVSEHMNLTADSSHVHLFRDVGNVTMDLSTIETADVNAVGGADTITVNDLTGTGLQDAAIDLGATPGGAGDGQPDSIIANGTDHADHVRVSSTTTSNVLISGLAPQIEIAGSEPADDTLTINTLAGNDTASVASGVSGAIQPIIDLGADE